MADLTIDEIAVADDPAAWRVAGFRVDDGACDIGSVRLRLAGRAAGRAIVGWSLRGLPPAAQLDGLPTERSDAPVREPAPAHPNGVVAIDHVVAFTPDRSRTTAALEAAGLRLRRLRDEPTPAGGGPQAFFRLGEVILEVIEQRTQNRNARLWGLAMTVRSLDLSREVLGSLLSEPRAAVQPGRQIATLTRAADLAVPIAFMTPPA